MKKLIHNKTIVFIWQIILTLISAVITAIGVKVFISPNGFVSIGVTGIGLLIGRVFDKINGTNYETQITGILLFVFNIPLLILAWKSLSKKFAILSIINVVVESIVLTFIPDSIGDTLMLSVPNYITYLDAAIFVGVVNGGAAALALIAGGSTGGIDILSMYFSRKKQVSIGKMIMILNIVIIGMGIFVGGGISALNKTFYTLVYLALDTLVIDLFFIRNKRIIMNIVTTKGDEICKEINKEVYRGVTKLDAKGAFTGEHRDFLYCACSSFEVEEIKKIVYSFDPHAFISVQEAMKVHGNFVNKEIR